MSVHAAQQEFHAEAQCSQRVLILCELCASAWKSDALQLPPRKIQPVCFFSLAEGAGEAESLGANLRGGLAMGSAAGGWDGFCSSAISLRKMSFWVPSSAAIS